jgi:hypothetical protein
MVVFLGSGQKITTTMLADNICVDKLGVYLQLSSTNWTMLMKGFCCHITTRCKNGGVTKYEIQLSNS